MNVLTWISYILSMVIFATYVSSSDLLPIKDRLSSLESRKCTLMVVTTPTGTATICAIQ